MKFSKLSQLFLVSSIGLLVATLLTSCEIVTINYVYVASSQGSTPGSAGQIQTYFMDSQSGALRAGQPSVLSGGTSPVALATTSDYENLYVVNQGGCGGSGGASCVVHFTITGDGILTQKESANTSTTAVSVAVNPANTFLFVVSGTASATLTVYPLASGVIGTAVSSVPLTLPAFASDVIIPTGVFALANNDAVYVSAYDQTAYNPGGNAPSSANPGWVFGFTIGSGGTLTAASASPFKAGVKPSALAGDPTSRFVYVTDFASNELIGYSINQESNLNFLINGPFKTGNEPQAVVVDPRGKYIYVCNALDNTVSAYVIDLGTGTPSVVSAPANAADTDPVALTVDASLGRFVFTANHLGNSVSGFNLNPNTGSLTTTQASPYPSGANPTAITSVPRGSHAIQTTTP